MEKRVLLAVVLSFIVLIGYQVLFPPPLPEQNAPAPAPATAPGSPAQTGQAAPQPPASQPATGGVEPVEEQAVIAADGERDITVETPMVAATFSTRGAVLKSWRLKHYRNAGGESLDLVPTALPDAIKPFTLETDDAGAADVLRKALFRPSLESLEVGSSPATLAFEYQNASGLHARKVFTFTPEQAYVIGFSAEVTAGGRSLPARIRWGPALGTGLVGGGMTYNPPPQPIFSRERDVTRLSADDLSEQSTYEGTFNFAGVDDHYFISAVIPREPVRVEFEPLKVPQEGTDDGLQFISWAVRFQSGLEDRRFFFGPKDFDVLATIDRDLVRAIDFGMFAWLVVPLLRSLKWLNGYVGNYGFSIILLTVLINLVMFPLRHKSVVSMRRMQELQPEVKAIQERYSKLKMSDPGRQKMNAELMNLYRERGVNPASGCIPMLLTFPVLLAFYSMLSVAIELRGAPFVGWIQDLSAHDPYFVTPILMGATMVIQQKMTPATADPIQQKMMMFMPIVFTFMFIWMPSGLVLYWTTSNVWAIGQQVVTNRLIGPPQQHAVRPPAERRVKTAGKGKSLQAAKERK